MTSSKTLLPLLASLLSLSAAACGGSTGAVDATENGTPAPSASSSHDDAGTATGNGNGGNASDAGASTSDAGTTTTNDAGSGPTFAANCNVPVSGPELCVEDVHGKPGDVIDLPIDFLGTSACTEALEASGHLVMASWFELTNPVQQVDCISRDLYAAPAPDTIEVMWDAFGGGAISACPNDVKTGRLDVVKIEILPGTPSGDYTVTWSNPGLASSVAACATFGTGIDGHIHVD